MGDAHVEYLGFTAGESNREYRFRVRHGAGEPHDFTRAIPTEAFLANRVRYQDAPDLCFHQLLRELVACTAGLPAPYLNVTDADLEEYRAAHAPKPAQRRPRPAPPRE